MKFVVPKYKESAFTCPHCGAYAQQSWDRYKVMQNTDKDSDLITEDSYYENCRNGWLSGEEIGVGSLGVSMCKACGKYHIWNEEKIVFPKIINSVISMPVEDMPEEVKSLYLEAREVYPISFKSSCALLRLAVQHLCIELGKNGKNINDDIGDLVSKGLPIQIQQALDIVRVVGNNAVHPGKMDEQDTKEYATKMFSLLNFIVEDRIVRPRQIEILYSGLPSNALKCIENRDKVTT